MDKMKLHTSVWKKFYLHEICKIEYGNKFDNNKMTHESDANIAFVTRTAENNGISDYVDKIGNIEPYEAGNITLALGGSLGSCFIQEMPFYTCQNVAVLRFDKQIQKEAKLFLISIISLECKYKYYPFGRELNAHIKKDFEIYLPATPSGDPDWNYMENYIKSLHYKPLSTGNNSGKAPALHPEEWKEFRVGDLFEVSYGSFIEENQIPNGVPYVTTTADNNGIGGSVLDAMYPSNCITVASDGNQGKSFYQPNAFATSNIVSTLQAKGKSRLNSCIGMFLVTIIEQESFRYNYGKKFSVDRVRNTVIKLPATPSGDPDWDYMENYVKSLPYGDRL